MRSLTTEDDKTGPDCSPLGGTKNLNGRFFSGNSLSSKGRGPSDPITDSRPPMVPSSPPPKTAEVRSGCNPPARLSIFFDAIYHHVCCE
jgi:hypothetical protein